MFVHSLVSVDGSSRGGSEPRAGDAGTSAPSSTRADYDREPALV